MNAYQQLKSGLEEDPLQFVFRSSFLTWFSVKNTKRILYFKWFSAQLLAVLGGIEIYNGSPDGYWRYTPYLIMAEANALVFLMGASNCDQCQDYSRLIKMQAWSWKLADDETYKELLSQGNRLKVLCCAMTCITITSLVVSVPIIGDEADWQITTLMSKKYLDDWMYTTYIILFSAEMLILGIYLASLFSVCIYCTCHMKFQLQVLNSIVRRLHTTSVFHVDDVRYQERVNVQLKCCVKVNVGILRLIRNITERTSPIVLAMAGYGLYVYIFSAYFLMAELSPRSNFRIYMYTIDTCIVLWAFCEYCQQFTNESEEVFFNACKCPWEQFDNRNRRTLWMLLLNNCNPLTLSCYGVLEANRKLVVTMWRMAYSVCTLFTNFN